MSASSFGRDLRIISGGQTGVDRAALDAAITLHLDHGGWCPLGRRAEDGVISDRYQLTETNARDYAERTRRNVVESDGTLILHRGPLTGGTLLTRQLANELDKPLFLIDLSAPPLPAIVYDWIVEKQIHTLNVAGPRESTSPGIQAAATGYLIKLLSDFCVK